MRKKKLSVMIIRSLLSIFVFSLIFSNIIDFNLDNMLSSLYYDIYDYSDSKSKEKTLERLDLVCENILIQNTKEYKKIYNMCSNKELLKKARDNCKKYYDLVNKKETEINKDLEESCARVLSTAFVKQCEQVEELPEMNTSTLINTCEQYRNAIISDKEFFVTLMMQGTKMPSISVPSIPNLNLPLSLFTLTLLMILSYLQRDNYKNLLYSIGKILANIGLMCILFYSILYIYNIISPPDTSFVLDSISGSQDPKFISKALPALLPLIFQNIITPPLFIIGIIIFIVGIILKIISRNKNK